MSARAKREAAELREQIDRANYRYYALDDPEVTDSEYDDWMRRLVALGKPSIPSSPIRRRPRSGSVPRP